MLNKMALNFTKDEQDKITSKSRENEIQKLKKKKLNHKGKKVLIFLKNGLQGTNCLCATILT